jgi:hypothetical protein
MPINFLSDLASPSFVTPILGTPSSGTLTSCVGLPIVNGTTGTLSVARGGTGVITSTGTGNNVLSASPTFTGNVTFTGLAYQPYHAVSNGQYFFDNYTGDRNLRWYVQGAYSDIIRNQPYTATEYWDGSAWVAWTAPSLFDVMLDGQRNTGTGGTKTGTSGITNTTKKFRFEVTASTSYPTQAIFWVETSWVGFTYPGLTAQIEEFNTTTNTWTTPITTTFTTANSVDNWGLAGFVTTSGLHTGYNRTRITLEFGTIATTGTYTSIDIRNIMITSNYTGTSNILPFSTDYGKNVTFGGSLTVPGTATFYGSVVLPSATSIGNVSSTEVSYLDGVTSAIQTQFSGKANSSHTHAAGNITTGVLGNSGKIGLANHPEGGGLFTPSHDNDLAFIIDRGGAVSFYKTTDLTYTAQTLTNTGAVGFSTAIPFNGTTNYATTTLAATTDIVVCDITMPFSLSYGNTWYVDFGNTVWGAKNLSFYAYQSANNLETGYKLVGTAIVNSNEHLKFTSGSYSHSKSPSGTGYTYNRLRVVMTNWYGLSPRIAAIGARYYNSPGLSTTLLSLGGGTMYGDVKLNNLTASQTLELDASKNIISAAKQTGYNLALSTTATDIKVNGTQSLGSLSTLARADHVHPTDTSRAPTASPSFTGS